MIDRKYIDHHHIVGRYLANQLSDAEAQRFERFVRDHPDMMEELGTVADFKLGLRALQADGQLERALRLRAWFRQPRLMVAAAVALLGVLALLMVVSRTTDSAPLLAASAAAVVDASGKPLAAGRTFELARVRGVDDATMVELPPAPGVIQLRLLLDVPDPSVRYRVRLEKAGQGDAGAQEVGRLAGLRVDADGFINVFLSSTALLPGRYRISVGPDLQLQDAAADSTHLISVVKPPDSAGPH